VVDVGDDGYVTKIFSAWHPVTLRGQHPKRRIVTLNPQALGGFEGPLDRFHGVLLGLGPWHP
jgi:hypothetical protein